MMEVNHCSRRRERNCNRHLRRILVEFFNQEIHNQISVDSDFCRLFHNL